MTISVLYQEPARFERAAALFASDLSALCEHTRVEVAAAIGRAIGTHHGIGGCAAEVAAAYGEHPETAAHRMRWALTVVERLVEPAAERAAEPAVERAAAPAVAPAAASNRAGSFRGGPSLIEQGYVPAHFGGIPVLVGPGLAAELRALRGKQP